MTRPNPANSWLGGRGVHPSITSLADVSNRIMSLTRLIYVSTATGILDEDELKRILESSVRHNSPQQVTGMLLYFDGSFMQVLEGDEAAIDEVMSRISNDRRHHSIFVLVKEPIETRESGSWSMGFKRLTKKDAESCPEFAPFFEAGFDARRMGATPGIAMGMLTEFANWNSR